MAVLLKWRFALEVDARTAWAGFSDTDRFNRAAGLGFTFSERPREDGTVARTGSVRKLGMTLTWDELPWEYEAPRWFRIRRRFHAGPLGELTVHCAVTPDGAGSVVTYEVQLEPRNALMWPLVWTDAQTAVRPQLDGALEALVATLRGEAVRYDPPPEPLSEEVVTELGQRVARLSSAAVGQGLVALLAHAPLTEQDRIQPRQLAKRWSVTEEQAVLGCLEAVREGVLTLRWELLCPSCQGPKDQRQTLGEMPVIVHCPSCNIAYDGTFPDSVNVVFRPEQWVRTFEVGVACALSPARTPAVIAAVVLAPGEERVVRLECTPGSYRLLPLPGRGTAVLEVSEDAPGAEASVHLDEDGALEPPVLRVQPGAAAVRIRSAASRSVQVQVKRRWRPAWTLTAGDLFAIRGARALLPAYALDPGLQVEVGRAAVLAVEAMRGDATEVETRLRDDHPHHLYRGDGIVIATFERFESAMLAAEPFAARPDRAAAVTVGPVAVLSREEGVVPSGSAVQEALVTLRKAGATRTALPARLVQDAEVNTALDQLAERVTVGRRPLDGRPALLVFPQRLLARGAPYEAAQMVAGIYRVTGLVGQGGMGTVYSAEDLVGGGRVVVKVLRQKLGSDPDHVARFYQEARVLQRLDHPRIVEVFDWGQDGHGRLYLAMERLEGRPLDTVLDARGPLPARAAVPLALDALDALDAAHAEGVVHRDIKPDNLFCSPQGRCTVLDFGIALDRTAIELEEEGEVWGTPRWMAPEQVEGKAVDGRTDAYAVALVLYEALTGAQPFPAGTAMASAMKRTAVAPVDIRSHGVDLPESLAAAVMKQLSLSPDERFPSAAALATALRSP